MAVIGPDRIDQGDWSRGAGANLVVILDGLAGADVPGRGGVVSAVLACDALVVVLPATVGMDPLTAGVWHAAAQAGLPRAVLVTELAEATADFEDLAAIAERVLGDDCVPVALPVFDDDGEVVGALNLADGVLQGPDGAEGVGRDHLRFAAGPRLRLLSQLATVVADDEVAERAIEVVAAADRDDPDSDLVVWGGSSTDSLWSLAGPLAAAVADGAVAPVVPNTPDSATVGQVLAWLYAAALSGPALVRRDEADEPCDGPAAVVLAVDGQRAVVRPCYGDTVVTEGLLTLTRTGAATADPAGRLAPYRAWPAGVVDHQSHVGYAMVTLTLRPSVGDVLTDRHLWLVPRDEDFGDVE